VQRRPPVIRDRRDRRAIGERGAEIVDAAERRRREHIQGRARGDQLVDNRVLAPIKRGRQRSLAVRQAGVGEGGIGGEDLPQSVGVASLGGVE
jgi:hypothetical protein